MNPALASSLLAFAATLAPTWASAQSPQTKLSLDDTRWFVELAPVPTDGPADRPRPTAQSVTLRFDGENVSIEGSRPIVKAAKFRLEIRSGSWHLSAEHQSEAQSGGKLVWDAKFPVKPVQPTTLSGTACWQITPENIVDYKLSGIRATALDDTKWQVVVTPAVSDAPEPDEEADPKGFPATVAFARGQVKIEATGEDATHPGFGSVLYQLNTGSTPWTIRAGSATDATVYELEIKDNTLTGTVREHRDGKPTVSFHVAGERQTAR